MRTKDVRALKNAVEQRWPISTEQAAALMKELNEIATSKTEKSRAKISAARAVISAMGQNQQDEFHADPNTNKTEQVVIYRLPDNNRDTKTNPPEQT